MKVKEGLIRFFTALMLGVYVLGIVGFDVHSCLASGKSFVVPLWNGELSCCAIHPEDLCSDGDCCGNCRHGHGNDCGTDNDCLHGYGNDCRRHGHPEHNHENGNAGETGNAKEDGTDSRGGYANGVTDRCCSDAFHFLELTGSCENHNDNFSEALSALTTTINLFFSAPQDFFRAAESGAASPSGIALRGRRLPGCDVLALLSVLRI